MTAIEGSAAVVTEAASGIGRALGLELAAHGCNVALADVNEDGLQRVAEEIRRAYPRKASIHRVDVSRPSEIESLAEAAIAEHPELNIVVNNAGVSLLGRLQELDTKQVQWLMDINFWGVVHGTQAFLPHLQGRPEAHIANVSSIYGVIAPPGQTAYAASKFAVRGFSESLRHELARQNSSVRISVVYPGGVATGIAENVVVGSGVTDRERREQLKGWFDRIARTTPRQAAQRIIRGIERNEPRILIGDDARAADLLQRLRPGNYWATLAGLIEKVSRVR